MPTLEVQESGSHDLPYRGGIISELRHIRRNIRREVAPVVGERYGDIISTGMRRNGSAAISDAERHIYWM